ncbi:hypothetical protein [Dyadobacter sp. CY345]|uniref:hypothetical protein n=1 Tax=Dyadobacter sp. CY345 TaxID=2909335 RepID=UPI001F363204|nr:hypothetical protein [Dyadobacter sp. CY345]
MAIHQGLTFGRDWVFTYGPLGFLSTRVPTYIGATPLIIYDIFTACVLIYILRIAFKELNNTAKWLAVPYFIMMSTHNSEATFQLFTLFIFLVFHHYRSHKLISLALATGISVLIFFIKLNLGIVTSVILYCYLLLAVFSDRKSWIKMIPFLGFHLLAIFSLSQIFQVDLFNYVKGALSIINNYNDAMFSVDFINLTARYAYFNMAIASVIILSLAIFFIYSLPTILKSHSDIFVLIVMLFAWYLGFKQGFTRFGFPGMSYPFFYGALFVGIAYIFIENEILKKRLGDVFMVFLFVSPFVSTGLGFSFNKITIPYQDVLFTNLSFQQKLSNHKNRIEYHIDSKIAKSFKGKTVDVVPYEIAYTFFNDLHYNPRPAIQSYQAYNNYLTSLNYDKYLSPTAPDYVLYTTVGPTDSQRYNFWSDSKTTLAMLQNYDYDTTTISKDTLQIVKKRAGALQIVKSGQKDLTFKLDEEVQVSQQNKLTWIEVKVKYSLWGKIMRVLVQPPVLRVKATYEDGTTEVFKAIISEIEAGIFLKKLQTNTEAEHFFRTRGQNQSITKLQFLQNHAGFQEDITAHLYDVSFQ